MKTKPVLCLLGFLAMLFGATTGWTKTFENSFLSFDLPAAWSCKLEGSEFTCQSEIPSEKKSSIIVLAAKYAGKQDSEAAYLAYLRTPKTYSFRGQQVTSTVRYARTARINAQTWVTALHDDSEIPGYTTKYLAAVNDSIAVLVTFSVSKDQYDRTGTELDAMMGSLRLKTVVRDSAR